VASRATFAFNDPGASSSRLPEFAWPRCLQERPTTAELPRRCIVRINEHGSKDRVKDASRSACNGVPCLRPVPTLMSRRMTSFPSWASFGHPLSPARSIPAEEAACTDYEPTKALIPTTHREACHLPEDRDALSRHDTRGIRFYRMLVAERLLLLRPHAGSLAHATHTFSTSLWKVLLLGLASVTVRSPAIRDGSSSQLGREYRRLFFTPSFMPGTDDPSMTGGSTDSAVDGS
jgi:hypothetical protein